MTKTLLANPDMIVDQVAARVGVGPPPWTAFCPEVAAAPMRWMNDAKARYYQAWLTEDLFGDWTLVTVCGGLGSRRGLARSTAVLSDEDGLTRIEGIARRRQQHRYQIALSSSTKAPVILDRSGKRRGKPGPC